MMTLVCLILDVGAHMHADIDRAVDCLKLLVQRDFFAEKKHEVALILCGTQSTANNVLTLDDKCPDNISLVRKLAPLDWDILEFLNKESLLSPNDASVVDAISIAVRHLVDQCKIRKKVSEKRIVLVSNLLGPAGNSVTELVDACNSADIQLSLIGCSLSSEDEDAVTDINIPGPSTRPHNHPNLRNKLQPDLLPITLLWKERNGESYLFSEAIPSLSLFEPRTVSQRGWKVDFQIGDSLCLPVEGFTQVRECRPPTLKHLYAADPSIPIRAVTTYHTEKTDDEVDPSQVIRGYRYGTTLVPFSDEDKATIKQSSEKCLSLIGFTSASNVPRSLYVGDSVLVFVPETTTSTASTSSVSPDPAATGLVALAQALFELDGVALVRRVYSRASAPRLGVLTPEIRGSQLVLVYTDLAFAEDVRQFEFPSLPVTQLRTDEQGETQHVAPDASQPSNPTEEQLSAMNSFVDAMMMGNAAHDSDDDDDAHAVGSGDSKEVDDNEAENTVDLEPERVPNPWLQRLFTCFRQRGLYPTEALIPSTSYQQDRSNTWLSASSLPGLEQLIARLDPKLSSVSPTVIEARQRLLQNLPALPSAHKPSDGSGDAVESESSAAKRRRLMTEELFGFSMNPAGTTAEQHPDARSSHPAGRSDIASDGELHVNSLGFGDLVDSFNRLISEGQLDEARDHLERGIVHLVTNLYASRSTAMTCLRAYRERSIELAITGNSQLAIGFNSFIRTWRTRVFGQTSGEFGVNNTVPSPSSVPPSEVERNRRAFWNDIIQQGFSFISDTEVPGIGVTQSEADLLNVSLSDSIPVNPLTKKLNIDSSRNLVVKDLLDDDDDD